MLVGESVAMDRKKTVHVAETDERRDTDEAFEQIRASLRGLRFGSVNIIVQDGVVIQIDRTEKHRLRVGNSRSG
jgi:hypothetical protein